MAGLNGLDKQVKGVEVSNDADDPEFARLMLKLHADHPNKQNNMSPQTDLAIHSPM